MAAKSWHSWLVLLLAALPALGADYSAGFDRSWVTPEVLELLSIVPPDEIALDNIAGAVQPVTLPDSWGDVVNDQGALPAGEVDAIQPSVWPVAVEDVPTASPGQVAEDVTGGDVQPVSVAPTVIEAAALSDLPGPIEGHVLAVVEWGKQEGKLDVESFGQWAAAHGLEQASLIATLDNMHLGYPLSDDYKPFAAAVLANAEENLSQLCELPPNARLFMAVYLGGQGRTEEATKLLESVTDEEIATLPDRHIALWHAGSNLVDARCYPAALYAFRRTSKRLTNVGQARGMAFDLQLACKGTGDEEAVRDDLIPYCQQVLGMSESGQGWGRALSALVWGYQYIGDHQQALSEGQKWLDRAQQLGIDTNASEFGGARLKLVRSLVALGKTQEAATVLKQIIRQSPAGDWAGEKAQIQLLKLAQTHPEIGEVEIIAPRFEHIWPEQYLVKTQAGQHLTKFVNVAGNSTFKVMGASCELPWIETSVGDAELAGQASSCQVSISIRPPEKAGTFSGVLEIHTNDADNAIIQVPLRVEVLAQ